MITHKPDPANDGPEVDITRFFRLFPEGASWALEYPGPMELFKQVRKKHHDLRTAKSIRKKRSRTSSRQST